MESSNSALPTGLRPLGLGALLLAVAGVAFAVGVWRSPTKSGGGGIHSPVPLAAFAEKIVGFVPARIDLGTQPWASVLPLELEFVNGGDSPVVISSISTTCNCAVFDSAAMSGRSVAPGETLQVSGSLETGSHAGALARSVTLTTNDQRQFVATLFVEVTGSWAVSADSRRGLDRGFDAAAGDGCDADRSAGKT